MTILQKCLQMKEKNPRIYILCDIYISIHIDLYLYHLYLYLPIYLFPHKKYVKSLRAQK